MESDVIESGPKVTTTEDELFELIRMADEENGELSIMMATLFLAHQQNEIEAPQMICGMCRAARLLLTGKAQTEHGEITSVNQKSGE